MSEGESRRSRRDTSVASRRATSAFDEAGHEITPGTLTRFVSEMLLLGGVIRLVLDRLADSSVVLRYLAALPGALVVAVVWGAFLSPVSPRRLSGAARYALEAVLFGTVVVLLVLGHRPVWAGLLAVTAIVGTMVARRDDRA